MQRASRASRRFVKRLLSPNKALQKNWTQKNKNRALPKSLIRKRFLKPINSSIGETSRTSGCKCAPRRMKTSVSWLEVSDHFPLVSIFNLMRDVCLRRRLPV